MLLRLGRPARRSSLLQAFTLQATTMNQYGNKGEDHKLLLHSFILLIIISVWRRPKQELDPHLTFPCFRDFNNDLSVEDPATRLLC